MKDQAIRGYELRIARMAEMLEASLARERALSIEVDALTLKIQILAREFELLKNSFRQSLD